MRIGPIEDGAPFDVLPVSSSTLVPFALWNKAAFLAERALGNVISSGIKMMVLAVIVGIGASFFADFTSALQGQTPDIAQAMSLALASFLLLGLGIFGPGIATGLVAGAPQPGAEAAVGTAAGAAIATAAPHFSARVRRWRQARAGWLRSAPAPPWGRLRPPRTGTASRRRVAPA